jgi:prepilin-type N-terminal cleavage/methylation domain-containing protein
MKTRYSFGFTLVEVLISMTIVSIIAGMILVGIMQLGESANRTKNFIKTRKQLSTFTQSIYNFINRSANVYFREVAGVNEIDYLGSYDPTIDSSPRWGDTLFLMKDSTQPNTGTNVGRIVYDPLAYTLTYFQDAATNTGGNEMLKDVYRVNYVDANNPGNAPIFRFPHSSILYRQGSRSQPLVVVIEFRRRIAAPTSVDPNAITIPVKLICKVDALN